MMKNGFRKTGFLVLACLLFSCAGSPASVPYRPLSDIPDADVLGNMQIKFETIHSEYLKEKVNEAAYINLMEAAGREYEGNIDVRDITWVHIGWSSVKHTNEFSASGTVVFFGKYSNPKAAAGGIEGAVARAAEQTLKNIPRGSRIAIYINAPDKSTTDYVAGELEFIWVDSGYTIIDRHQLDRLREEQNFQISGEVDDETAVSIGKIAGAGIIVIGTVDGEDDLRRLRLRALDVQTAQVIGVASERL